MILGLILCYRTDRLLGGGGGVIRVEGSGLGRGPENFFVYGPNQLVGLIRNKLIVSFVRRLAFIPVGSEGETCVASTV